MSDSRTCAGCDACCTVMAVRELDKGPGARCRHLLAERPGCGIWGGHPASCRAFHCLWRTQPDLLPQRLFPPEAGFLVSISAAAAGPLALQVCALPGRRHAWNTPENRELFRSLSTDQNAVVTIVGDDGRPSHAFTPSGRVYSRSLHPEVFPAHGGSVAVPASDYRPAARPVTPVTTPAA